MYGALKLKEANERQNYLDEFVDVVKVRYDGIDKELGHLEEYLKIDHLAEESLEKSRLILNFYVRETFYYGLTNSILRVSNSSESFRPVAIPFNENYHAIKTFYLEYKKQVTRPKKLVCYRGSTLRKSDVERLKVGGFVELLGFTSTSVSRREAEKFMRGSDSYLIEIIVETRA